jgi:drug/metabolite transporter (DMT)-like permease
MLEIVVGSLSVILIATSQLLFKSAAASKARGLRGYLLHPKIFLGLGLNGLAAACWIIALRRLEISYLYPMLSVNYLLVPLGAQWIFGEKIRRQRFIAIGVICIGVFICLLGG